MSITTNNKNRLTMYCDTCGETLQESYTFDELMHNHRQAGGWTVNGDDGEWYHYCDRNCRNGVRN